MKRGLKVLRAPPVVLFSCQVAASDPMKRGLKAGGEIINQSKIGVVAASDPMKRGLKDTVRWDTFRVLPRCSV